MPAKTPVPTVLQGRHIRLEPYTHAHLPDLFAAGGGDDEVWRWMPVATPQTEAELRAVADTLLAAAPDQIVFTVVDLASGRAVGWTTYHEVVPADERLEIGWTWYGRSVWRTAVNTEAKLLLLTHAFDDLGMGRVQWKTDHMNTRSQNAVLRLGAQREGLLRRHRLRPDGTWRSSVYFSLLVDEWPEAKARLTARLAQA
jgi:RimJ/RimL family protein N-acetyltransferase